MKVGIFVADLVPESGGGYTIQDDIFQSLAQLVGESQHEFVVFCHPTLARSRAVAPRRMQIIAYQRPNLLERALNKANSEFELVRLMWNRSNQLERIARAYGIEVMWLVSDQPVRLDVPYITNVWDLQHRLQPWFPEVGAGKVWNQREAYYSWFLRRASIVIAGTETGRQEIERFYQVPPERIKILPHPTPQFALRATVEDDESVLSKYGVPTNYLFYPAQFWSHKNHANLMLAVRHLQDEYGVALSVVLVGSDKGNQAYVQRLVRDLGLTERVYVLGFVPQEDLVLLYRHAFALVYLTFFGPENLPPLEAFALGCPVIASNVAGATEQLGDAAILVNPKRPDEIARALKLLHDNPDLRAQLVQRGQARAAQWTGHDFVRGVFAILDEFQAIRRCWDK